MIMFVLLLSLSTLPNIKKLKAKARLVLHVQVISELAYWVSSMVSHNCTCSPTQASTPGLTPDSEGWHSIYLPRRDVRLS